MATELEFGYVPREPFLPFHHRRERFAAMCVHRRGGKTVACIGDEILKAINCPLPNGRYAYVGPYRQQTKEIVWQYVKDMTGNLRKGQPRESELRVNFHNGASLQLYGADNADAMRGLYFDGIICDEYGDWRPSIWGEIILPCLMDRDGWAVFIGTMKGKNHFYRLLKKAETDPNWYHLLLPASKSGILSDEALAMYRAEVDDAQYRQEMECDPDAKVVGTYYSEIIAEMENQGRIGKVPYDPHYSVKVATDIGFTDSCAWWFWQETDDGIKVIDYYENEGEALPHYTAMLDEKPYEYSDIFLPHDAAAATFQTGRSTIEQFIEWSQNKFTIHKVPRLAKQHGIEAGRLMLNAAEIDATLCEDGIEALRAYRRKFNEVTQQFSNEPLHDWASNGADGWRYFSLVAQTPKVRDKAAENVRPLLQQPEYRLDDLWKARDEALNWRSKVIRL